MPPTSDKYAIGIDLGSTYCSVAVFNDGIVKVVEDEQGNRRIPSYVAFTTDEYLVGFPAKSQAAVNSSNTVYGVKRLLGRKFGPDLELNKQYWPFTVIEEEGRPKIEVQYKKETNKFCPEEITALVLTAMKEMAETYTGKDSVSDVVISVPANFSFMQREATKYAAKIAGLNVLQLIDDTTAAALAYCTEKKITDKRNMLVFDLGGGSFDVSMLAIQNGNVEVKAVSGETNLGGDDFVNNMLRHIVKDFQQNGNIDTTNKKFLAILKDACEVAKKELSKVPETRIQVEGCDYSHTVNAKIFNEYNETLYNKMMVHLNEVLNKSSIGKDNFSILLVGGCTRIPKVEEMLKLKFSGVRISKGINRDEAVAYGAAVRAAALPRKASSNALPHEGSSDALPHEDSSDALQHESSSDALLCEASSDGLPHKDGSDALLREGSSVALPHEGSSDALPHEGSSDATVHILGNERDKEVIVDTYCISEYEIETMKNRAQELKNDCNSYKEQMGSRNNLEGHIISVQAQLKNKDNSDNSDVIMGVCDKILEWMSSNEKATKADYESKHKDLLKTLEENNFQEISGSSSLPTNATSESKVSQPENQSIQNSGSTSNGTTRKESTSKWDTRKERIRIFLTNFFKQMRKQKQSQLPQSNSKNINTTSFANLSQNQDADKKETQETRAGTNNTL